MKSSIKWLRSLLPIVLLSLSFSQGFAADKPKIRALLITGGCCHNYLFQSTALIEGVRPHVDVDWTIVLEGGFGTRGKAEFYNRKDWHKNYDIVVHNECFANTAEEEYVKGITEVHKQGLPAIVIHCAMHTYRAAKFDDWREFLGVTSRRHDHQSKYPTKVVNTDHPTMKGFPSDWVSPKDELYIVEKIWPNATPLVTAKSERNGKEHAVFWTNQYGKAKVFGTTFGHTNETFTDRVFLDTIARGMIWATGK